MEGTFLGSPAYASPEQAAGKSVDLRTDIYSLGVMAFELLTGELPFMADGFREVLMKHMVTPPPHLPPELLATELGRTLDGILQTCLAKEAADRVLSAQQLAEMFHRLSGDEEAADRLAMRRPSGHRDFARTGMLGGAHGAGDAAPGAGPPASSRACACSHAAAGRVRRRGGVDAAGGAGRRAGPARDWSGRGRSARAAEGRAPGPARSREACVRWTRQPRWIRFNDRRRRR